MGKLLQFPLDAFYWTRKGLAWLIAYLSLRLCGYEVSAKDVWNGAYSKRHHQNRDLGNSKDLSAVLSAAKDCHKSSHERRATVADKCKTLLTLSSILLALAGLLLPKPLVFDAPWSRIIFFVAMGGLLNTILLLLLFFDVGTETEISLDQEDVELGEDDLKRNFINLYLQAQVALDNRTDYLIDLFRAARFFFLSSLALVVTLFAATFLWHTPADGVAATIERLRAEPGMIDLLRGPKGLAGEAGAKGPAGDQGVRGEKGDRGNDAVVDMERLLEQVLEDARLSKMVDDAMKKNAPSRPAQTNVP